MIRLSDWQIPNWMLKVIASFLSGRTMVVNYKGEQSSSYPLPGSLAQGDELSVILFLVPVSDICLPPPTPRPLPLHPGDVSTCVPPLPPPVSSDELRLKWIDDIVTAETVCLKKCLVKGPDIIGPKNKREQSGFILPPESFQTSSNENQ